MEMKTTTKEALTVAVMFSTVFLWLWILSGCSGWTYNGIRGDDLRRASGSDLAAMGLGVATTYAIHSLGHVATAEIMGKPWHYYGLSEIVDGQMSDCQAAWFGRSGFIAQLSFGYAMSHIRGIPGYFQKGYNSGTLFEISTYPAMNRAFNSGGGDDFEMIGRNGNPDLEYASYTALALGLNFK